jgi:hypothetical protein
MIYAHMSKYRTDSVHLVNKCQKIHNQNPTMKKNPLPCTPAPAASSTRKFRVPPVTGIPARLTRSSAIPAAVDPAMPEKLHVPAAATGPGAIKDILSFFHGQSAGSAIATGKHTCHKHICNQRTR